MMQVLIVGCGNIAGRYEHDKCADMPLTHAAAYAQHPEFEIAGCVDPDVERRQSFVERWRVPAGHGSIREAYAGGKTYDVVSVCSPTETHEGYLQELLDQPVSVVFCEKPLGTEFAPLRSIVEEYKNRNISLAVNYSRRWDPELQTLKQELDNGTWGAIRSIVGYYSKGIVNNGGHLIDLISCLIGPLKVQWAGNSRADYSQSDPTIDVVLSSSDGIPVHLCTADARDYALFELHIITELGIIEMEQSGFVLRHRRATESDKFPGYKVIDEGIFSDGGYKNTMSMAVQNIYSHMTNGAVLRCTGEMALETVRLCESIKESMRI